MSEPNTTQASPPAILFVDDEATAVKYFQRAIGSMAAVVTGGSVAEGKVLLDTHAGSLAVLVSDQRMPGEYGNELLRYAREKYPHIVRILTTAYSEIEQTVEAVNEGEIHRYIRKPWDITALRMELKQALEISGLRRERDQLVREKLGVLQRQTIAARIGMVHALTASLIGTGRFQPVETYLSTAALVGVVNPEPDWLRMDYADLVGAESSRSGGFGHAVATRLAELRGQPAGDALGVIAQALGEGAVRRSGDALVLTAPELVGEYLSRPVGEAVSPIHAGWMAGLLRLEESGTAVAATREGTEIVLRAATPGGSFSSDRLAIWIEQF
jgi:two-component system probable response regulator PhcQ